MHDSRSRLPASLGAVQARNAVRESGFCVARVAYLLRTSVIRWMVPSLLYYVAKLATYIEFECIPIGSSRRACVFV